MSSSTNIPSLRTTDNEPSRPNGRCSSFRINKSYLPFKFIYFLQNGGQTPILFRALFMKHVGMSTKQIGMIWAVDRILGIFAAPLAGVISDKVKKPIVNNQLILLFGGLLCALMYLIPIEQAAEFIDWKCFTLSGPSSSSSSSSLPSSSSSSPSPPDLQWTLHRNSTLDRSSTSSDFLNNSCLLINETQDKILLNSSTSHHLFDNFSFNLSNASSSEFCLCSSSASYTIDEYGVTFWTLIVLIIVTSAATSSSNALIDTLILNQFSEKDRHNYGLQRVWGAIGFGVSGLFVGYLKDVFTSLDLGGNSPFISFAFYPIALWLPACFFIGCIKSSGIDKKQPFKFSQLKGIFSDIRMLFFLLLITAYGFAIGAGEIYMFWLAEERFGAASTILGMTVVAAEVVDVLMYISSTFLAQRFTPNFLMTCATFLLAFRLVLYTLATAAWHFIAIELLRGGVALGWVAACNQVARMTPPELRATVIGVTTACSRALGYGMSALFGGIMIEKYGCDVMFQTSFVVSTLVSVIYFVFYNWYDRRAVKKDKQKIEEEELKALKVNDEHNTASTSLKKMLKKRNLQRSECDATSNCDATKQTRNCSPTETLSSSQDHTPISSPLLLPLIYYHLGTAEPGGPGCPDSSKIYEEGRTCIQTPPRFLKQTLFGKENNNF